MSDRRAYRFGPVERHGFLGAIRAGQAVVVVLGVLVGFVLIRSSPAPGGAVGAVVVVGLSVVAATTPIAGRTIEEWIPVAGGWVVRRITGEYRVRSLTPTSGLRFAGRGQASADYLALPPALRGIRIIEVPYRDRSLGVVSERRGRYLTAVLACRVVSFSLLDAANQERCLSHWGSVISAAADTPVRRIQWLERTEPAEPEQLARWLQAERDPALPVGGTAIMESYLELVDRAIRVSQEHEVLVAVQVDASRVRGRGRDTVEKSLMEETERVAEGLRRTGARIQGALTGRHLATAFRTAFDPYVRAQLVSNGSGLRDSFTSAEHSAWPVGATEEWDHYRTDGAVHATYWIAGWPRVEVGALFLDPLLSQAGAVRTVAVTFEPVSAQRSIREVEAQVTRDQADRALKARFGQAETARQEQAYGATRRREAELASGYGEVRFAGFITVSAGNVDHLREACGEVRRDASRSRLELHPMYGQQAEAFTFTLPVCRGLR